MLDDSSQSGIVVFSGGSAANALVDVFKNVSEANNCSLNYVIPISDNGGSSSELIRVFGGPGIGDLRSRLVRLIPDDGRSGGEMQAIRTFFNHRLSPDPEKARIEWLDIVEARHLLWKGISSAKKELIRSFLNLVNMELVKRARPSSVFSFQKASVGNMFVTGARLFSGSLESAIYLLSSICMIPHNVTVLPAISSNFSYHICAGLANGETIVGQNAISHPTSPTAAPSYPQQIPPAVDSRGDLVSPTRFAADADTIEDANMPGTLPSLRTQNINFAKVDGNSSDDLPARIERVWYINPYGQEIRPYANSKVIETTSSARTIIFSIGSLYTSLAPCLVLRGVGEAIATSIAREKILILNGSLDRETGPMSKPFTALDFVRAVARAAMESMGVFQRDIDDMDLRRYVTHVIYVDGEGTPELVKADFIAAGIETVRVYGRRSSSGSGWRYDEKALSQALEAIIGRRVVKSDVSRRNTLRN